MGAYVWIRFLAALGRSKVHAEAAKGAPGLTASGI